jgi:hypothetical protein
MLKSYANFSFARIANILFILIYAITFWAAGEWQKPQTRAGRGVLTSDTFEYYSYLSMTFLVADPFYYNWENEPHWEYAWVQETPGGSQRTLKMTMGMSMLYAPFFGVSHGLAKLFGLQADGYSEIYQFGILFSALFWLSIGLYCLRKVLERFFSPAVVVLTLLAIMLATNIDWYLFIRVGITHPYTFSFSSILLFLVTKWYDKPNFRDAALLGAVMGILALIRPVNALFSLCFLLFGLVSKEAIQERIKVYLKHYKMLLLIALTGFLVLLPQFIFWKLTTGSFLYYTYHDEGFFFNNPQFYQGLLGYRNGWLRYTPVMFLALVGIPFMWFRMREWFWVLATFIPIYIFVVVSWWCWWYIGYGNRAMIDSYGLLALPMATTIGMIWEGRKWRKFVAIGLVTLFVSHNIFQTIQCKLGIIHILAMSKKAYWKTFLSLEKPENYGEYLSFPDMAAAKKGEEVLKIE